MLKRKSPKFIVGLFLILGFLIGSVVVIWVGASKYFEKGDLYAVYFDESIQGLQKDSVVKYQGLAVGRVVAVGLAPDHVLIEVDMKLNLPSDLRRNCVARLTPIGITGLVLIDLTRKESDEPDRSPRLAFVSRYPVIPSRPSRLKQLEMHAERIMGKLEDLDLKQVSRRVQAALTSAEDILTGPRVQRFLTNMDSISSKLDVTADRVSRIIARGDLDRLVKETGETLRESRILMQRIGREVDAARLGETASRMDRTIASLERDSRRIMGEIGATGENLNRASSSLEVLIQRLEANPSDLLFSRPPPPGRAK